MTAVGCSDLLDLIVFLCLMSVTQLPSSFVWSQPYENPPSKGDECKNDADDQGDSL